MRCIFSHIPAIILAAHAFAGRDDARAQTYPTRPLSVIVAASPGDPGDVVARLIQSRLAENLGQPWLVEARPGASAKIATQAVARAAPDGHTLLVTMSAHAINPSASSDLAYDTVRDFVGVSMIARQPLIVGVHPSVAGRDLKEFIAAARANPSGKLSYSSPGTGTLSYLVGEQIVRRGGIDMPHVPFRGGSPAVQAVLANEVQMTALIPFLLMPHIKAGAMRAIAVTGASRLPALPDAPTLAESGFDATPIYNWIGVFAPAGTPRHVIERLNAEINSAVREPATARKLVDAGLEIVASTPDDLDRFIVAEIDRWRRFTREYNVRFD